MNYAINNRKEWESKGQMITTELVSNYNKREAEEAERLAKEKEAAAEELAIAIENVRLAEERRERAKKNQRPPSRRGLLSWIFGWLWSSGSSSSQNEYEEMTREVSL